ncbi:hypothetical protein WJ970_23625 [Achromobacter xylosoxidans]
MVGVVDVLLGVAGEAHDADAGSDDGELAGRRRRFAGGGVAQ